jgi:hypothetical protein
VPEWQRLAGGVVALVLLGGAWWISGWIRKWWKR